MSQNKALSIDVGRAAPLVFESPAAAERWMQEEMDAWEWIRHRRVQTVRDYTDNFQEEFRGLLDAAMGDIRQWQKTPEHEKQVTDRLKELYERKRYPMSTDPIWQVADRLVQADLHDVAACAVAACMGKLRFDSGRAPLAVIRGAVEAAMLDGGVGQNTPDDIWRSLKRIADISADHLANAQSEAAAQKKELEEQLEASQARLVALEKELRESWVTKIQESIDRINSTNELYASHMELAAAVDYWKQQATLYATSRWWLTWSVVAFAFIALLAGIGAGVEVIPLLIATEPTQSPNLLIVSAALFVLGTTILFWIGRILVRLFLSAHHLRIDALERIAMVKTFLALVKEQELDRSDRALVLAPLFRPSADGIVKDEGAPDASLSALVARLLAKP
ncbi:MAG: DUF6161 domain-containing protein [Gammaproteobacteria bacterium]